MTSGVAHASPPRCVVLATGNAGKLREMRDILHPWQIEVRSLAEFTDQGADETGLSFVENALLKARHAAAVSDLPAIADDSGLEVDALQGAPGIYSARYAGNAASDDANNAKLLRELQAVPECQRTARYRCAMVFLRSAEDPAPVIVEAHWDGTIARSSAGSGGFGYDPLFIVEGGTLTAAEIPATRKDQLSHRGRALRALVTALVKQPE